MVRAPYWQADRILSLAAVCWEAFDGACALTDLDPSTLPPHRLCNAFVRWLRAEVGDDVQQWKRITDHLFTGPPPSTIRQPAQRDRAAEAAATEEYLRARDATMS